MQRTHTPTLYNFHIKGCIYLTNLEISRRKKYNIFHDFSSNIKPSFISLQKEQNVLPGFIWQHSSFEHLCVFTHTLCLPVANQALVHCVSYIEDLTLAECQLIRIRFLKMVKVDPNQEKEHWFKLLTMKRQSYFLLLRCMLRH